MEDVGIIIEKLDRIERDIHNLKTSMRGNQPPLKLRGIWAGVDVTIEDIEKAKESLFKISTQEEL